MKYALLFTMLLVFTCSSAQVVGKSPKSSATNNGNQVAPVRTVPPGSYRMAPDNMACVVPDLSTVAPMPNGVKRGDAIPFMPNGLRKTPIMMVKATNFPAKSPK